MTYKNLNSNKLNGLAMKAYYPAFIFRIRLFQGFLLLLGYEKQLGKDSIIPKRYRRIMDLMG